MTEKLCSGKIIPHGYFEIIFNLSSPIYFDTPKQNRYSIKQGESVFFGQFNKGIQLDLPKKFKVLILKIYPWSLPAFIDYNANDLVNTAVKPEFIFGKTFKEIQYELLIEKNDDEKIKKLESFLSQKVKQYYTLRSSLFTQVCSHILQQHGFVAIKNIIQSVGAKRRTLEIQFKSNIGCTATQFSRKARLRYIADVYAQGQLNNFTFLAHYCGYYDQAHFIKDFKCVLDQPPKQFFKQTPFVDYFFKSSHEN